MDKIQENSAIHGRNKRINEMTGGGIKGSNSVLKVPMLGNEIVSHISKLVPYAWRVPCTVLRRYAISLGNA